MNTPTLLGHTTSVCPVCLQRLPARKIAQGGGIYLEKICPDHGDFRVLIWKGTPEEYLAWADPKPPTRPAVCDTPIDKGCPYDCGLCPDHAQQTCCVLLEITPRCNLHCPVCFASTETGSDPSLDTIAAWYDSLARQGKFNIQLSGGEPTLRDDLPEILRMGREKGFEFFQLNTNGLRLAQPGYAKELVKAGANCAFLQFDGLTDDVYTALRGRPLLDIKLAALEQCAAAGLGVVLVPTVVRGINDDQLGDLLRFALDHMPHVRGVHFQPISYFGRYDGAPPQDRLTLPELMDDIQAQTQGQFARADFSKGSAENAYCSFHGNFLLLEDGELRPLKPKEDESPRRSCCGGAYQQSREVVARRWSQQAQACCNKPQTPSCCGDAPQANSCCGDAPQATSCCGDAPAPQKDMFDLFLERLQNYTLAVSCMAFQDAWTLDLDRLKECYICEVNPQGRLIPFCAYNLTDTQGRSLYRSKP